MKVKLKIGLIGLGKITQIKHIHYLMDSPNYKIVAISDLSDILLNEVKKKYQIQSCYENYKDMLLNRELQAIFVLNHDHAEPIIQCLEAGFHVFTEKPLCWTEKETLLIDKAIKKSSKKLMVGYMKRYISIMKEVKELFKDKKDIKSIHVRTYASGVKGHLPYKIIKDPSMKENERIAQKNILSKIKEYNGFTDEQTKDYKMLMELGIHNLNLLIYLFGLPTNIEYISFWESKTLNNELHGKENVNKHRMGLIVLVLENNVRCIFELGAFFDNSKEWEDYFLITSSELDYRIDFPNPFLRDSSVKVTEKRVGESEPIVSKYFEDAFKLEIEAFYNYIINDDFTLANWQEGKQDIEFIKKLTMEMI